MYGLRIRTGRIVGPAIEVKKFDDHEMSLRRLTDNPRGCLLFVQGDQFYLITKRPSLADQVMEIIKTNRVFQEPGVNFWHCTDEDEDWIVLKDREIARKLGANLKTRIFSNYKSMFKEEE